MRLGVHLARYAVPGGSHHLPAVLAEFGSTCDQAGVDVVSLPDHYLMPPYQGGVDEPMLEGYTTLGFLAAHTRRVELQLLVTGVTYRHPGLLGQIVATLDILSSGRAALGIGAGWYEREHRAYGVPFPVLRDRFELLEEALQQLRDSWTSGAAFPMPLHPIPVMMDGVGERKALRLVARYADACHLFAGGELGAEFVAGKLAVLREHCEAEGIPYDRLRRTILWTPVIDPAGPAEFLEAMRAMAQVGVDQVHLVAGEEPVGFVRQLGDSVLPVLAGL